VAKRSDPRRQGTAGPEALQEATMPLGGAVLSEPKRAESQRAERPVPAPVLPDPEIVAIVEARHGDPFAFLGMHKSGTGLVVRAMLPGVEQVLVIESATGAIAA
jgi:hypothetical protein